MGNIGKLFFNKDNNEETLLGRITLLDEQLSKAIQEKDDLITSIRPEISASLDNMEVKYWLQGSYKNHTLIRPINKINEFDIDIGLYILCNAEKDEISALYVKELLKSILSFYVTKKSYIKLEESKSNCERISFPDYSFHLDIPLYYYDNENDICKLATQDDEWIESDPKKLQSWFDENIKQFDKEEKSQLRRIIKYLKIWSVLKNVNLPSIAITTLVVIYYSADYKEDDDVFLFTALGIIEHIKNNSKLDNPVQSGYLYNFDKGEYETIVKHIITLEKTLNYINETSDSFKEYNAWSLIFEHMFPHYNLHEQVLSNSYLPIITKQPKIKTQHKCIKNKQISCNIQEKIIAFKGETLSFSIENSHEYDSNVQVHWIVRNQGDTSKFFNDLGHRAILTLTDEQVESTMYPGTHFMECIVLDGNNIKGISNVKVIIKPFLRPKRNPVKRNYIKR